MQLIVTPCADGVLRSRNVLGGHSVRTAQHLSSGCRNVPRVQSFLPKSSLHTVVFTQPKLYNRKADMGIMCLRYHWILPQWRDHPYLHWIIPQCYPKCCILGVQWSYIGRWRHLYQAIYDLCTFPYPLSLPNLFIRNVNSHLVPSSALLHHLKQIYLVHIHHWSQV